VRHLVLIGFSDLNEMYVAQSGFYRFHFMQCVHSQLQFGKGGVGEVCYLATGVRSAVSNIQTSGELTCSPRWWTSQYWDSRNTGHRS
jgi:hypothetical protein